MAASIQEIVLAVLKRLKASGKLSDDICSELSLLFGDTFEKALEIIDNNKISIIRAKVSGREFFRLQGSGGGSYDVLKAGPGLCSCQSWMRDVLGMPKIYWCKHILSARIAECIQGHEQEVGSAGQLKSVIAIEVHELEEAQFIQEYASIS